MAIPTRPANYDRYVKIWIPIRALNIKGVKIWIEDWSRCLEDPRGLGYPQDVVLYRIYELKKRLLELQIKEAASHDQ